MINGSVLPDKKIVSEIAGLKAGERLMKEEVMIAVNLSKDAVSQLESITGLKTGLEKKYMEDVTRISFNWDIFTKNDQA